MAKSLTEAAHSSGHITLLQADALALPLADSTVDLVVTSPPYFGLRSYQDGGEHYEGQIGDEATPSEFIDALLAATREMMRVLKPSGSIWVNLGDKYSGYNNGSGKGRSLTGTARSEARMRDLTAEANPNTYGVPAKSLIGIPWRYAIRCIDELGLILRAEVIWSKPNGLPESVTDRVRRSHENWFHFTLNPRYYSAVDEIREPHQHPEVKRKGPRSARGEVDGNAQHQRMGLSPLGKLPSSVWSISTGHLRVPESLGIAHFASFPVDFPHRIILGWSPRDVCSSCGDGRKPTRSGEYVCSCADTSAPSTPGIVLDPFGGSGTVALVASLLGRDSISIDLSADYNRLAEWRTSDPKQIANAQKNMLKYQTYLSSTHN